MFKLLGLPISLGVLISAFWFDYSGWIFLLIFTIIIQSAVFVFKSENSQHQLTDAWPLSFQARIMLRDYRHRFEYPMSCQEVAGLCALNSFLGIFYVAINCFNEIYWTIPLALLNWLSLGYAATFLNPVDWFKHSDRMEIYEEACNHVIANNYRV
jgi:hypothetical protein